MGLFLVFEMKLIIAIFVALASAGWIEDLNNDPKSTWKAKEYPPEVITLESMRAKLIRPWRSHTGSKFVGRLVKAPDAFDARDQWGSLILPVRDQAQCGSCWAFAVAETTSDRIGISTGTSNGNYSPQDLVSCDTNDYGCSGGYVDLSWQYVLKTGLALDDCIPYTSGGGDSGRCPSTCNNGSAIVRTKAKTVYPVTYANMQDELTTYGPFEVAFDVYADFMNYQSGVYQHTSGGLEGGHAVLVVGWGVDSGTPYWIVQNSWGTDWGIDGFFWILRGADECGIEDDAYAGQF